MVDTVPIQDEATMKPHTQSPVVLEGDVDASGHLATGLFVGVIAVILMLIYALAMASA